MGLTCRINPLDFKRSQRPSKSLWTVGLLTDMKAHAIGRDNKLLGLNGGFR
jgi:hypothetical protein